MFVKRTTRISFIAAAVIAGAWLGLHGYIAWWPLLALAILVGIIARKQRWAWIALVGIALWVGVWRGHDSLVAQHSLQGLIGQKVVATASVADDPVVTKTTSFTLANARVNGHAMPGKISVYMQPTHLQRGYQVQLEGKVKPGFGSSIIELSYPKLTVISTDQGWLERLRQRFFAGMRTALPEPMASFGLGLLIGVRALIPKDLQVQLSAVGLSHLVAVSGYNLTIIVNAMRRLLGRLGANITLVATAWMIAGFVVVSGAGASIVRASLVASLSLLAGSRGRKFDPHNLILGTAALTAAWNPAYLHDLGWLLSYFAFYGIMVIAPAVDARLAWRKRAVTSLMLESLSAQVVTTPLIMLIFGQLSLIAPISNVIILPMVPVAMFVCFVAGLMGMLIPAFVGWVAWPATLLLGLMLAIVHALAGLSFASIQLGLGMVQTITIYGLLVILTAVIAARVKAKTQVIVEVL